MLRVGCLFHIRMIHDGKRCLLKIEVVFKVAEPCTPDSRNDAIIEVCFTSSARPLLGQLSLRCVAPCVLIGTQTPCCETTLALLISWLSCQIICAWSAGLTANLHSYKSLAPCSGSPWVPDVTLTRKTQHSSEYVLADSWHYHLCCSGMTQRARKFSKHAKRCLPLPRSWCFWVTAPRKCWPLPFSSLQ